jgi:hypothetical protein
MFPVATVARPVPPLATETIPVREMLGLAPPLLDSGALAVTAPTPEASVCQAAPVEKRSELEVVLK